MSHPFGLSDDEFLSCLGPSWSEMTHSERIAYPRHAVPDVPCEVLPLPEPPRVNSRARAARERFAFMLGLPA